MSPAPIGKRTRVRDKTRLSRQEARVLQLIAVGGLDDDQIARRLGISYYTLRYYVRSAFNRLLARNRTHAVALALASGQIDYPPERTRRAL